MAISGKKAYKFYLNEENVEFLRAQLERRHVDGGLSGFIDKYLARTVWMVKNNKESFDKMKPGKLTWRNIWQLWKIQYNLEVDRINCEHENEK